MKGSERAYAKHRGCSRSSVQEARRTGRLSASVARDGDGKITIDFEAADREWAATTKAGHVPMTGRTAPKPRPSTPTPDLGSVAKRLVALVAEYQADTLEGIAKHYVPAVLTGAVEGLRARGAGVSADEVAEALGLDEGLDGPALQLVSDVMDLATGAEPGEVVAAQAAGREAVAPDAEATCGE